MRVTETATLLALGREDFAALLARQEPPAFRLKRHLATLLAARLRSQLEDLAVSLGGASPARRPPMRRGDCRAGVLRPARQQVRPPDGDVPRLRLAGALGLPDLRALCPCPPGRTLLAEGAPSTAYYLTINGAVEKVLVRGDRRIRVGLAGPGKAFGYESLIDGRPSPVTAITRERALMLVLPRDPFEQLFNGEDAGSRVFLDVIQRDLMATLRQTLRPYARLAASR